MRAIRSRGRRANSGPIVDIVDFTSPVLAQRGLPSSSIPTVALQDLDLVAVGVDDKEEARHKRAVSVKLLDLTGLQSRAGKTLAFYSTVVDAHRKVAVTIAMPIWLSASAVQRQFEFEIALFVAQIGEREIVEFEPVGHLKSKS